MASEVTEEVWEKGEDTGEPSFWFWKGKDRLFLGLGTMLYQNFLRFTALLFFLLFICAIPNMSNNFKGGKFTVESVGGSQFAWFVASASISNLGSASWTPGGEAACSDHGFGALVCAAGGWNNGPANEWADSPLPAEDIASGAFLNASHGTTVYSYECGRAPLGTPGILPALVHDRAPISGEVNYTCTRKVFMCLCFPGFVGSDCSAYAGPLGYNITADVNITAEDAALEQALASAMGDPYGYGNLSVPLEKPVPYPADEIYAAVNQSLTYLHLYGAGNASRVGKLAGLSPFAQREERARALAATNIDPASLGIVGFCVQARPVWAPDVKALPEFDPKASPPTTPAAWNHKQTSILGICSGHGACLARLTGSGDLLFTFCECNLGWFGAQCEWAEDVTQDVFGTISNDAVPLGDGLAGAGQCLAGALPFLSYNFKLFSLPTQYCSDSSGADNHGLGIKFPTLEDGRLNISSVYRAQTAGVCFCEPGYAGEQCRGGAPVPSQYSIIGAVQTLVFLTMLTIMYRSRKQFEIDVNAIVISPSDFTAFVLVPSGLNARKSGGLDVARVRHHFSQWGPIHVVAPAIDDWSAQLLQQEKNRVLKLLHVKLEEAEFNRTMALHRAELRRKRAQDRADKASRAAARAAGADVEEPDPKEIRAAEITQIMAEPDWEEHDEEQRARALQLGIRLPPPFDLAEPRPPWYLVLAPETAENCISHPIKAFRPAALPPANTDTLYELEYETNAEKVKAAEAAAEAAAAAGIAPVATAAGAAVAGAAGAAAGAARGAPGGAVAVGAPAVSAGAAAGAAAGTAAGAAAGGTAAGAGPAGATAAPGAQAGAVGTVNVVKGRRVFPAVEISRFSRVLMRLPGTAALFNTRFLRAYGRWLETQITVLRNDLELSFFENCFVTFMYSSDANDCVKTYELAELFEVQAKIDPRLKQIRQTQGLSEGEYFYQSKRTGKRKLVNIHFQTQGIDRIRKQLAPHMPAAVKKAEELRAQQVGELASKRTEVYLPPLRGVEREELEVEDAMDPEEVMWGAMDSQPADQARLAVYFIIYQLIISLVCFLIVFTLNSKPPAGSTGKLLAPIVVTITNQFGARQWQYIIHFEENYSVGATMRSIFFKTVTIQLAITLLSATLAVFGLPFDTKNGYIQDFYVGAGTFLSTSILVDAAVDAVTDVIDPPRRIKSVKSARAKSRLVWFETQQPASYKLEMMTAGTMRMIVLVSAFSPGCPPILLSGSISLFLTYVSASNSMMSDLKLLRSGPELSRALEYSLTLCAILNAGMSWGTYSTYWQSNALSMYAFLMAVFLVIWALMGYFSWKMMDAKDAFFGYGVLPGANRLPLSVRNIIVPPLQSAHTRFMNLVFGRKFYWLPAQLQTYDATNGRPYPDISRSDQASLGETGAGLGEHAELQLVMAKFSMRYYPYHAAERTEIFPDLGSSEPLQPSWNGEEMMDWAQREKRADRIFFRKVEKARYYGRSPPPMPRSVALNIARATGGGAMAFYPKTAAEALAMLLTEYKKVLAPVVEPLRNEFYYMDKDGDGALSAADAKAARVPQAVFLAILNAVGMTSHGSLDEETFVLLKLQAGVGGRVPMDIRQETAHLMVELQAFQAFERLHALGRVRMGVLEMRSALRDAGLGDAGIKDESAGALRLERFDSDQDGMLEIGDFFSLLAAERGVVPSKSLLARRAAKASKRIRSLLAALTPLQRVTSKCPIMSPPTAPNHLPNSPELLTSNASSTAARTPSLPLP